MFEKEKRWRHRCHGPKGLTSVLLTCIVFVSCRVSCSMFSHVTSWAAAPPTILFSILLLPAFFAFPRNARQHVAAAYLCARGSRLALGYGVFERRLGWSTCTLAVFFACLERVHPLPVGVWRRRAVISERAGTYLCEVESGTWGPWLAQTGGPARARKVCRRTDQRPSGKYQLFTSAGHGDPPSASVRQCCSRIHRPSLTARQND